MLTKRKATKKSLDELRKIMPVLSEIQQQRYVAGYACNDAMSVMPTVSYEEVTPFGVQQIQPMFSSGSYMGCWSNPVSLHQHQHMVRMGTWQGGWVDGVSAFGSTAFVAADQSQYRSSCVFHVFSSLSGKSTEHFFNQTSNQLRLQPCPNGGVPSQYIERIGSFGGLNVQFYSGFLPPQGKQSVMMFDCPRAGMDHLVNVTGTTVINGRQYVTYRCPTHNRYGRVLAADKSINFWTVK